MSYKTNREYSNKFIPAIISTVGPYLVTEASFELDTKEATDLIVLKARDMRIAARIRRKEYMAYKNEFTLRSKLDSGVETELSKIINGWGDWLFYGFGDESNASLVYWNIIDLSAFRAALIRKDTLSLRHGDKSNGDGTHFKWFDVKSFPTNPPLIIGASHDG
jgi:hypothetical protein